MVLLDPCKADVQFGQFTLNDVVSYNDKHNEANGEDNRDGHSSYYSWNHGAEGPTDDLEIIKAKAQPPCDNTAIARDAHDPRG